MNDLWIPVLGIGLIVYAYSKADKMGRAAIITMIIVSVIWMFFASATHR